MEWYHSKEIHHNVSMTPSPPLTPHSFIEVRLQVCSLNPFPALLTKFQSAPTGLHLLGMDTSYWIHKMMGVNHNLMRSHIGECRKSPVCPPIVCMHLCTWQDASLDDREEGRRISPFHDLEITTGWRELGTYYSKYPSIASSSSPVKLQKRERDRNFIFRLSDFAV